MNNQQTRRGNTQEVAHKTKNNTYRLGVSPTGVASKNENVQRNARKLSGSHPTYKGDSVPSRNKVILNLIQDLQRLLLLFPLINNLRGRSHIKYGMTPLFDNNGCVEDAQQQHLSIRLFNEKYKKNTFISPLTWATPLLSPTGEEPFPMRGKVAEGRMRGILSVLPQSGAHPTYKGNSVPSVRMPAYFFSIMSICGNIFLFCRLYGHVFWVRKNCLPRKILLRRKRCLNLRWRLNMWTVN